MLRFEIGCSRGACSMGGRYCQEDRPSAGVSSGRQLSGKKTPMPARRRRAGIGVYPLENSFLVVQGSIAYQNDRMNLTDQEPLRYPDYLLGERRYRQKCEQGFHKQFWGDEFLAKRSKTL